MLALRAAVLRPPIARMPNVRFRRFSALNGHLRLKTATLLTYSSDKFLNMVLGQAHVLIELTDLSETGKTNSDYNCPALSS